MDNSAAAPEIQKAFVEHDRQATFTNFQVACYLGILLMPAGVVLDWFVYPQRIRFFLVLRLACSALITFFWAIARTNVGRKHYRLLGLVLAMLPTFFISGLRVARSVTTSISIGW